MPRDGNGTYFRVPGSSYANGSEADGAELDAEMNDLGAALTQSLPRDGQAGMQGPLNMGNNSIDNVAQITATNFQGAGIQVNTFTAIGPSGLKINILGDNVNYGRISATQITGGARILTVGASSGVDLDIEAIGAGAGVQLRRTFTTTQRTAVLLGTAESLSTTETDAFVYMPTMAGAPTAQPRAYFSGDARTAMIVDAVNSRLYVRIGSTWRYAPLI